MKFVLVLLVGAVTGCASVETNALYDDALHCMKLHAMLVRDRNSVLPAVTDVPVTDQERACVVRDGPLDAYAELILKKWRLRVKKGSFSLQNARQVVPSMDMLLGPGWGERYGQTPPAAVGLWPLGTQVERP